MMLPLDTQPSSNDFPESSLSSVSESTTLSSSPQTSTTNTFWGTTAPAPSTTSRQVWMIEKAAEITRKRHELLGRNASKKTSTDYSVPLVLWDTFCKELHEGDTNVEEHKIIAFLDYVIHAMRTEGRLSPEGGDVLVESRHQGEIGLTTVDPVDDLEGASKEADTIRNNVNAALASADGCVYIRVPPAMTFMNRCFASLKSELINQKVTGKNSADKKKITLAMNATLSRYGRLLVRYVKPRPSARSKNTSIAPLKGQCSPQPSLRATRASLSHQELESRSTDLDHVKYEQLEYSAAMQSQKQDDSEESNAASGLSHSDQRSKSHSAELGDKGSEQPERSTTAALSLTELEATLNTVRDHLAGLKRQEKMGQQLFERLEGLIDKICKLQDDRNVEIDGMRGELQALSNGIARVAVNNGTGHSTTSQDALLDTRKEGVWLSRTVGGPCRPVQALSRSLSWSGPSGEN
ncbi:hypothetical protein MVEG_07935 [Podila verticillata NRRL 6337]|nr:hypothetical protein MVEG_07935 [Podila verticillata NRRL 6337]